MATVERDLQIVFNDVMAGAEIRIQFAEHKQYESTRTALLRKFKRYIDLLDNLGGSNPFQGQFFRCAWSRENCTGTFRLEDDRRRTNTPGGRILQVIQEVANEQESVQAK